MRAQNNLPEYEEACGPQKARRLALPYCMLFCLGSLSPVILATAAPLPYCEGSIYNNYGTKRYLRMSEPVKCPGIIYSPDIQSIPVLMVSTQQITCPNHENEYAVISFMSPGAVNFKKCACRERHSDDASNSEKWRYNQTMLVARFAVRSCMPNRKSRQSCGKAECVVSGNVSDSLRGGVAA